MTASKTEYIDKYIYFGKKTDNRYLVDYIGKLINEYKLCGIEIWIGRTEFGIDWRKDLIDIDNETSLPVFVGVLNHV
jgi:hypothetical protein